MSRFEQDIIVAPATLSGGAIALIRMSGEGSIALADRFFEGRKKLADCKGHTIHYGNFVEAGGEVVDDVMVSIFRAPNSYTSEESVEISCHGSAYIVQKIIEKLISGGARMANAGEFTVRAFMAGRLDLSQAEGVAATIGSTDRATHRLAATQMRGGYSEKLEKLRTELVRLGSLLELELDFSEEDVEFADRGELEDLMRRLKGEVEQLCNSFQLGNAIKNGVSVAIVGAPNAGKSTLLNQLLGEDRAMVSAVAGTTRDSIEEMMTIDGVTFRFIDTAGLHETSDELERMGIERSYKAIERAQIIIHLIDVADYKSGNFEAIECSSEQQLIRVVNKIDLDSEGVSDSDVLAISAQSGAGVDLLRASLISTIDLSALYSGDVIVSNARHYQHLVAASESLDRAIESLRSGVSGDLLSDDLRHTLHEIGSITGLITNDEILATIFSTFCIGK
ncbi:MAG: tRNA uridine-5-carboxymethylaminomethyl(34) synthesis GTPase MnmE [Rikenellaceae bacterium]